MEITVAMTAGEFEEFRAWQKDKLTNERHFKMWRDEIENNVNRIRSKMLKSIAELPTSAEIKPEYEIADHSELAEALDAAAEWMA